MVTRARAWATGAAKARTVRPSATAGRRRILGVILPQSAGGRIVWSHARLWKGRRASVRRAIRRSVGRAIRRSVGRSVGHRRRGRKAGVGGRASRRQAVRRQAETIMYGALIGQLWAPGGRPAVLPRGVRLTREDRARRR